MPRPNKRSMAARKAWATKRSKLAEVPPSETLDDLRVMVDKAHGLISDGIIMVNEGWDLINAIPRRVT